LTSGATLFDFRFLRRFFLLSDNKEDALFTHNVISAIMKQKQNIFLGGDEVASVID